jgi:hypothetical protein
MPRTRSARDLNLLTAIVHAVVSKAAMTRLLPDALRGA